MLGRRIIYLGKDQQNLRRKSKGPTGRAPDSRRFSVRWHRVCPALSPSSRRCFNGGDPKMILGKVKEDLYSMRQSWPNCSSAWSSFKGQGEIFESPIQGP